LLLKIEILVPIRYNDGREIEDIKFQTTYDKISKKFGARTVGGNSLLGNWVDPETGILYDDERFNPCWVVCENTNSNIEYFRTLKKELEQVFKQESIFIYYIEVDIIK
jgi:hypothetical protein